MTQSDRDASAFLGNRAHPPMFNIPTVVIWLILLLAGVHVLRAYGIVDDQSIELFGFYSARACGISDTIPQPLVVASRLWSFVSYSFFHADWMHLLINCVWMLAFGSFVARRLGTVRFLVLSAAGSIAGAGLYLALHENECAVLIGASAAISAQVAAAARLMFARPLVMQSADLGSMARRPALSLAQTFTNGRALSFILVWLALNLLSGITGIGTSGDGRIAWEAHLGGFIAGLVLLGFLDRRSDR